MNILNNIKITVEMISGFEFVKDTSRSVNVVDARRVFCYLAKELTEFSYEKIGAFINKNHSTVQYHNKKAKDLLEVDKKFERLYRKCSESLSQSNGEKRHLEKYRYHLNKARLYHNLLKINDNE